jgi:hypothetical protein
MKKTLPLLSLLWLMALSCKKSNDTPAGTAFFRVVHGVPNAASLEVRVNGTLVGTLGSYGLSLPYQSFTEGNLSVEVRVSGTTTVLSNPTISATANNYYTFVVADSLNKLKSSLYTEDAAPVAGKAKINVLHLGTISGSADFATGGTGSISLSTNRSFNDQSTSAARAAYTTVDPLSTTIEARVPGAGTPPLVITSITQNLVAGKTYTLVYRNPVGTSTLPSFTLNTNN